jgi:WD40 repeat protein
MNTIKLNTTPNSNSTTNNRNENVIDFKLELFHGIGYNGSIINSLLLHPNMIEYIYLAGGVIVIAEMNDPNKQHFLRGHDNEVTTISLSNNGKLLASGQKGENSDILIWDYQGRRVIFTLSEHDYAVTILKFSHDDKLLYSNGNTVDKKIFVWDVSSGNIVSSCSLFPSPTVYMTWGGMVKDHRNLPTDNYLFANCGENLLCIWKLDPLKGLMEKEIVQTGNFLREYTCILFSKDEKYLFAGTASGDIISFIVKNKSMVFSQIICAGGITAIAAIDNNQIIVGGGDGSLVLLYIEGYHCEELARVKVYGSIFSLSTSADGVQMLASTDKGFIYRIRSIDLSYIILNENHTSSVVSLFSLNDPDYKFGTCSMDGTIRLWNLEDSNVISRIYLGGSIKPNCATFTSEILISGWDDERIRCHKIEDSESKIIFI